MQSLSEDSEHARFTYFRALSESDILMSVNQEDLNWS